MKAIVCSFVEATGSAVVNGKEWRWEFHKFCGPTFLCKNGEPLKNQPGEKHPVWEAFNDWLEAYLGHPLAWREAERQQKAAMQNGSITTGGRR